MDVHHCIDIFILFLSSGIGHTYPDALIFIAVMYISRHDCSSMILGVKSGCVDCSGKLCTRDLTNSLRRSPNEGDAKCDSADTDTPNDFYCPNFNYDDGDCVTAKRFV